MSERAIWALLAGWPLTCILAALVAATLNATGVVNLEGQPPATAPPTIVLPERRLPPMSDDLARYRVCGPGAPDTEAADYLCGRL